MSQPPISVVMCVYNEEKFVRAALGSVLGQTFGDFEVVLIDDASDDATGDIIHGFDDKRIRYFRNEENVGLTMSLNRGLEFARGDLIARMDGNDVCAAERFERQVVCFEDNPNLDLVWTGVSYLSEDDRYVCRRRAVSERKAIDLLLSCRDNFPVGKNYVNHVTTMFRKSSVIKVGGYDERVKWGQDGNLWCRMLKAGCNFMMLDAALVFVRLTSGGITDKRGVESIEACERYSNVCLTNRAYLNSWWFWWGMRLGRRKMSQASKICKRMIAEGVLRRNRLDSEKVV